MDRPCPRVSSVFRTDSMPGDYSLFYENLIGRAGVIRALLPNGFQIGNDPTVNQLAVGYQWLAFANTTVNADIAVGMTVDEAAPREGDAVAYLINVGNNGPVAATNVQITDLLPAGLTFRSATASKGTYLSASGVWQVGRPSGGRAPLSLPGRHLRCRHCGKHHHEHGHGHGTVRNGSDCGQRCRQRGGHRRQRACGQHRRPAAGQGRGRCSPERGPVDHLRRRPHQCRPRPGHRCRGQADLLPVGSQLTRRRRPPRAPTIT